MDIWIIRNGEKNGPFRDFEIRHKIEDGELSSTTAAWHQGLPAWQPLGEIDLFKREFELDHQQEIAGAIEEPSSPAITPPPLPKKNIYGRRFWARWFDLYLFSGIWWIAMWWAGRDIEATLSNPWVMIFQYVPWFILEAFLLHRFGFTPGKWLLGLKVTNTDGSALNLSASTRRSMRVLFTGIGFGWGLLAVFCQGLSLFTARRLGSPLWDHAGGHTVTSTPLSPLRVGALAVLFFAALQLQWIVVAPHIIKAVGNNFPKLQEQYQKNPPWHLPKRS
jgi:uncharacterized RDD family membrane protein YckC